MAKPNKIKDDCKNKENKVKYNTPFWENYGYSAEEWEQRKRFERAGCNQFTYCVYESDLDIFEM